MPENIPELVTDQYFQRSITDTKQNKQINKQSTPRYDIVKLQTTEGERPLNQPKGRDPGQR